MPTFNPNAPPNAAFASSQSNQGPAPSAQQFVAAPPYGANVYYGPYDPRYTGPGPADPRYTGPGPADPRYTGPSPFDSSLTPPDFSNCPVRAKSDNLLAIENPAGTQILQKLAQIQQNIMDLLNLADQLQRCGMVNAARDLRTFVRRNALLPR